MPDRTLQAVRYSSGRIGETPSIDVRQGLRDIRNWAASQVRCTVRTARSLPRKLKDNATFYIKSPPDLGRELKAGLAVGMVLVPEAVMFALMAGMPSISGVYASFFLCLVTSVLTRRPGIVSAAAGAASSVVADLTSDEGPLSDLPLADRQNSVTLACFIAAILVFVAGLCDAGRVARVLPRSVTIGFMNGLAIVILKAQVPSLQFCAIKDTPFEDCPHDDKEWLPPSDLSTWLFIGNIIICAAVMVLWPRTRAGSIVPSAIVALALGTGIEYGISRALAGAGGRLVSGTAPLVPAWPHPSVPSAPASGAARWAVAERVMYLTGVGIAVPAVVVRLVSEATGRRCADAHVTAELKASGAGNALASAFGGFSGAALAGESLLALAFGARGRLAGIVAAFAVLGLGVGAAVGVNQLPLAAMSGMMVGIALRVFHWPSFSLLVRARKSDALVVLAVAALSVATNFALAVAAGIAIACAVSAWDAARLIKVTAGDARCRGCRSRAVRARRSAAAAAAAAAEEEAAAAAYGRRSVWGRSGSVSMPSVGPPLVPHPALTGAAPAEVRSAERRPPTLVITGGDATGAGAADIDTGSGSGSDVAPSASVATGGGPSPVLPHGSQAPTPLASMAVVAAVRRQNLLQQQDQHPEKCSQEIEKMETPKSALLTSSETRRAQKGSSDQVPAPRLRETGFDTLRGGFSQSPIVSPSLPHAHSVGSTPRAHVSPWQGALSLRDTATARAAHPVRGGTDSHAIGASISTTPTYQRRSVGPIFGPSGALGCGGSEFIGESPRMRASASALPPLGRANTSSLAAAQDNVRRPSAEKMYDPRMGPFTPPTSSRHRHALPPPPLALHASRRGQGGDGIRAAQTPLSDAASIPTGRRPLWSREPNHALRGGIVARRDQPWMRNKHATVTTTKERHGDDNDQDDGSICLSDNDSDEDDDNDNDDDHDGVAELAPLTPVRARVRRSGSLQGTTARFFRSPDRLHSRNQDEQTVDAEPPRESSDCCDDCPVTGNERRPSFSGMFPPRHTVTIPSLPLQGQPSDHGLRAGRRSQQWPGVVPPLRRRPHRGDLQQHRLRTLSRVGLEDSSSDNYGEHEPHHHHHLGGHRFGFGHNDGDDEHSSGDDDGFHAHEDALQTPHGVTPATPAASQSHPHLRGLRHHRRLDPGGYGSSLGGAGGYAPGPDGNPRPGCRCIRVYSCQGTLFFASCTAFLLPFEPANDPPRVRLDFSRATITDLSAAEAVGGLLAKYDALNQAAQSAAVAAARDAAATEAAAAEAMRQRHEQPNQARVQALSQAEGRARCLVSGRRWSNVREPSEQVRDIEMGIMSPLSVRSDDIAPPANLGQGQEHPTAHISSPRARGPGWQGRADGAAVSIPAAAESDMVTHASQRQVVIVGLGRKSVRQLERVPGLRELAAKLAAVGVGAGGGHHAGGDVWGWSDGFDSDSESDSIRDDVHVRLQDSHFSRYGDEVAQGGIGDPVQGQGRRRADSSGVTELAQAAQRAGVGAFAALSMPPTAPSLLPSRPSAVSEISMSPTAHSMRQ